MAPSFRRRRLRICSLLPSSTEIVYTLGLGDSLVGVTHECDYPQEASTKPAVTSSIVDHSESSNAEIHRHISRAIHEGSSIYTLDQDLLAELDPELILTQELCDVCAVSYNDVQQAVRFLPNEHTILSLEPLSLADILRTISSVGELTGTLQQAADVVGALTTRIDAVKNAAKDVKGRPRVFAMEWLDPPFIGGHWVPEMIRLAGGVDGLGHEGQASTQATWDAIAAYDPDIIVLMPCGYHLHETVTAFRDTVMPREWQNLRAVREGAIYAVDGSSYYNRPGPRIIDGLEILGEILHPEIFARTHGDTDWQHLAV